MTPEQRAKAIVENAHPRDIEISIATHIRAAVEAERAKYRALVKAADAMHGLIRPDSRLDKIHLDCAIEEYEAARKELP